MTDSANQKKAIVLLSGGIDSATTLAVAKKHGAMVYALSFDYGQRHRIELQAAKAISESLGAYSHRIVTIDIRQFGGSALTDNIAVPKNQRRKAGEIPVTYVPARNLIFLSIAIAYAETLGVSDVFIGANEIDYSGYPDCRPEFLASFERTANLATKAGVEGSKLVMQAPLIGKSKAEIIKLGTKLGVDYSLTLSCYDPDESGRACGSCDSCRIRRQGFRRAGVSDPTVYAAAGRVTV